MRKQKRIAIIVGSLRRGSFSRKIAKVLKELAPAHLACDFVEISELQMYNQDLDRNPPRSWQKFRRQISEADGVLFVTPEYNRSLPGCLKNALDVGSRPQGKNAFDGKPAGIVSVTPYSSGAAGANYALRQSLIYLNMPTMQQPEAYIGQVETLLNKDGEIKTKKSEKVFTHFMQAYGQWVDSVCNIAKEDFEAFLKKREQISDRYITGDANSLHEILTKDQLATFFAPNGSVAKTSKAARENYDKGAKAFGPKSTGKFDIFQHGSSGQLAFWTGYQISKMQVKGKKELVPMNIRVTEIFRYEDGGWKIVHRHADMPSQS